MELWNADKHYDEIMQIMGISFQTVNNWRKTLKLEKRWPNSHKTPRPSKVVPDDSCPKCHSNDIHKYGYYRNLKDRLQRFRCQDCGKTFLKIVS